MIFVQTYEKHILHIIFINLWSFVSLWCELQQMYLMYKNIVQFNYNHGIVMLTSIFVDLSKFDMWHYGEFWVIFKKILISIIHYDCSFYMVLNYYT